MVSRKYSALAGGLLCLLVARPSLAIEPQQQPLIELPASGSPATKGAHSGAVGPSVQYAINNAPNVFNTLHSAMRQWGSSLKHNGMSFFPVAVPEGTLFYHGSPSNESIKGMEWLAFEIEHAEMFALEMSRRRGRRPPRKGEPPKSRTPAKSEKGHTSDKFEKDDDDDGEEIHHGYLHTYQAKKPLTRLLYVDGMSGGKTTQGTLDTQDFVLRSISPNASASIHSTDSQSNSDSGKLPNGNAPGDYARANDLCSVGAKWGVEGILRCEAGFEIILCNFTDGVNLLHINQRPIPRDEAFASNNAKLDEMTRFEYMRAVASRYGGIGGGRVKVRYDRLVSAYFYNTNLTNPRVPRPKGLPRLLQTDDVLLGRIKDDVGMMMQTYNAEVTTGDDGGVDWQGVVDMIVTRYSDRLKFLVDPLTSNMAFLSELGTLLRVYVDYAEETVDWERAREVCQLHYLQPVTLKTQADGLIYAAVQNVTGTICTVLIDAWKSLSIEAAEGGEEEEEEEEAGENMRKKHKKLEKAKASVQKLMGWLDWTTWLRCGTCAYNEMCFTAMWPFGAVEDHESPSCINHTHIGSRQGYWHHGGL